MYCETHVSLFSQHRLLSGLPIKLQGFNCFVFVPTSANRQNGEGRKDNQRVSSSETGA